MCFGREPKPRRRPHNNRRIVKTLEQHGYGIDINKIVTQLYLDRDTRGEVRRPLASDVLLSFWKHFAQKPVRSLREIIFQTVKEPSTKRVRDHAYRVLQKGSLRTVRLRSQSGGIEGEEFDRAHGEAKLGKCVRTIATEYIEMKEGHARIVQFKFVPHGPRGADFHFVVALDYDR
ncbi:hypothetical protein INS49_015779 [Diaporthe citri]|uniref:uncharacterized protein n=1 Tax=Diaporthe citri TaxID=83186 RepID=UPI001C80C309|nr:uncharacterized protein INS49_015779 [Diaporthe citri]KAG6356391.1 hypothetical protein INS49_015779 [Diaporthe citri]